MSVTVRAVLTALLLALALPITTAAPAHAASYCTFRDGVVTAHVPAGHFVRLLLYPSGRIYYGDNSDSSRAAYCGKGSIANTRRVRVIGHGYGAQLLYDQVYGAFAHGGREIKFRLVRIKRLWLKGVDGDDHIVVGRRGLDLGADGDLDIRVDRVCDDLSLFLLDGNDTADARGSAATGDPWPRKRFLSFSGHDGNDVLSGRPGRDLLYGMEGADRLLGRAGNDELDAWGIDSVLVGGRGNDALSGAAAPMTFLAGPGDDVIRANTLVLDHLIDGGDGYDIGFVDLGDPVVGVEELRTRAQQ
jgi:Ca2+-binding RTX toxin-like protein